VRWIRLTAAPTGPHCLTIFYKPVLSQVIGLFWPLAHFRNRRIWFGNKALLQFSLFGYGRVSFDSRVAVTVANTTAFDVSES
jgi:hypothetical protein